MEEKLIIFFDRIQVADAEYKASFDEELNAFKERIRKRAAEKIEEAIKEQEEEERKARLGPGGLDPIEVLESLPEVSRPTSPVCSFRYGKSRDTHRERGAHCHVTLASHQLALMVPCIPRISTHRGNKLSPLSL